MQTAYILTTRGTTIVEADEFVIDMPDGTMLFVYNDTKLVGVFSMADIIDAHLSGAR